MVGEEEEWSDRCKRVSGILNLLLISLAVVVWAFYTGILKFILKKYQRYFRVGMPKVRND